MMQRSSREQPPQWCRHSLLQTPVAQRSMVTSIAEEQLIASVAGQCHGNVGSREPAHQRAWHSGSIRERFIEHRRQVQYFRNDFAIADVQLGMEGAEMSRDPPGPWGLVELRGAEADRVTAHRSGPLRLLHQRGHTRRIRTTGEEHSNRHVPDHAIRHCITQKRVKGVLGVLLGSGKRCSQRREHACVCIPVRALFARRAVRSSAAGDQCSIDPQHTAGHQLECAFVDGVRRGDVIEAQQQAKRIAIDARGECRMAPQRLQFGTKYEGIASPAVIQGLLADAIAR